MEKKEFEKRTQEIYEKGIYFELPVVAEPGGQALLASAVVDALNALIKNSPNLAIEYSWVSEKSWMRVWAFTPHPIGYYAIGQAVERASFTFAKRYDQVRMHANELATQLKDVCETLIHMHPGLAWEFTDDEYIDQLKADVLPNAIEMIERYGDPMSGIEKKV